MRWGLLVVPPLLLTITLLSGSLFIFLSSSLHEDLGLGLLKEEYSLYNFRQILEYPSYLDGFFLTLRLSFYVCLCTLIITWPLAYILSRLPPKLSMLLRTDPSRVLCRPADQGIGADDPFRHRQLCDGRPARDRAGR